MDQLHERTAIQLGPRQHQQRRSPARQGKCWMGAGEEALELGHAANSTGALAALAWGTGPGSEKVQEPCTWNQALGQQR